MFFPSKKNPPFRDNFRDSALREPRVWRGKLLGIRNGDQKKLHMGVSQK